MSRSKRAALTAGSLGLIGVLAAAVSAPLLAGSAEVRSAQWVAGSRGASPARRTAGSEGAHLTGTGAPADARVSLAAAQPSQAISSDKLVEALAQALESPAGPRQRELLEAGLQQGKTDYDVAELAFRLLSRVDPAAHAELCRSLAADPRAAVPLLAGVLVTLESLDPAAATRVIADLARSQAAAGGPVQREEIARGSLRELVRRGAEAEVRAQLLAPNAPARLWAAAALHAEGRLLGAGGLTSAEAEQLAQRLAREAGDDASDEDRLELLAALPFAARFEAAVGRLSDAELDAELARSLALAAADRVPDTAGAELGARLAHATQAAPAGARERLLRLQLALPPRALAPGQRRQAERELADLRQSVASLR